jgi:hypothetical protein
MKLYVASKFHNYVEARRIIDLFKTAGHEITCDWTRNEEFDLKTGEPLMYNDGAPIEVQRRVSHGDRIGILRCERFILLTQPEMKGGMVEFGMAIMTGVPIDVVDPNQCYTVFYTIETVTIFETVDELLASYGIGPEES